MPDWWGQPSHRPSEWFCTMLYAPPPKLAACSRSKRTCPGQHRRGRSYWWCAPWDRQHVLRTPTERRPSRLRRGDMEANGNTTQATAALYLRTSNIDERAGDNRSITDQRHDLERLAEFVGESRRPAASVASQLSSSDRYIRLSDSSQYAARKLLRARSAMSWYDRSNASATWR